MKSYSFTTLAVVFLLYTFSFASATTFNVTVAPKGKLCFDPETLTAAVGDQVIFEFISGNHTVTQSTLDSPCTAALNGFDSEFEPVRNIESNTFPTYRIDINNLSPIYVFSQQPGAYEKGMVFAVNTPADPDIHSFSNFQDRANHTVEIPAVSPPTSNSTTNEPVDHLIVVGQDGLLQFGPTNIKANVGDTVTFEFHPKNNSVIQSSYMDPCRPLEDTNGIFGFNPGFVPLPDNISSFPRFQITIENALPIWGYCGQVNHCAAGMLFAINALEDGEINFAGFVQRALMINGTETLSGYPTPTSKNMGNRVLPMSFSSSILMLCFQTSIFNFFF